MKHEDIKILNNNNKFIGKVVNVCGWIRTIRKSKNMCFIEINDGTSLKNLQLVFDLSKGFDLNNLNTGTSIAVNGILVYSKNNIQNVELNVQNFKVLGNCPKDYPIQKKKQNLEYLREYPHLRTRTNTFNAAFRIRSVIVQSIFDYLQKNDFIYVNSPIITGSNCEGAGEMFRVTTLNINDISCNSYNDNLDNDDFFGKRVNLTVSGQLEAEAMACSLGKVFTFGPSFRAENSNTKRHAAEFWLFEPEMAFTNLNETIIFVNKMIKHIFDKLLNECCDELYFFNKYYDNSLLEKLTSVINNEFVNLDYMDAINILLNSNTHFEFPVYYGCDLKYEHLKYITDKIYNRPVYIINYPKNFKPFYIKLNPDGKTVASADLYFPGIGDIIGISQKEDNFDLLNTRIKELNMTEEDYYWYLDLRKYGSVEHSGFGLGVERLMMYVTGLENIRDTIAFPRTKCKKLKL